jgi:DNA polymerase-3 subunit gamma/tau
MAKSKARPSPAPEAAAPPAEYTVVARRYRPQQFADLVGQEHVARALTNAIRTDRVAHAYLFTGARGTGKTSTARILAKALDCVHGPTPTPCDQCEICLSIAAGEDIDVREIDGASNRNLDDVRDLRQNVGTRPSRARFKIYIIDEVHMLTRESFNALLKTLEEPPPHVKFIFATTEVQKIPITILSRCQRFDFTGIPSSRIAERLQQIVAAEGREADPEALKILARRAGGSMRDSQSLLDQLLAFTDQRLTAETVHQLLGSATDERVLELVDAVAAKDAPRAFDLLGRFAEEGLQLGELLDQLIEYWRALMLLSTAGKDAGGVTLSDANREKAYQHAQGQSLDTVLAGLDVLTTAKARLRATNQALVLLEMAVLRLIRLDDLIPVAQLSQWLTQSGAVPSTPRPAPAKPVPSADPGKKNITAAPERPANGNGHANTTTATGGLNLDEVWGQVGEKVGPILSGNMRASGLPAIIGPKSLVLRFGPGYTAQYDYCAEPGSVQRIQEALKAVTGQEWLVRVDQESSPVASAPKNGTEPKAQKPITSREREQDVLRAPLLNRAVEKLGARLLKRDDGFGAEPDVTNEADPAGPQES